ncbi:MAG: lipid-A-disaccharide synthase [Desulfobacterales bacterium]|nr:lipid-A-disaccharide synthase [Desulfobacterales bacterium]
MEKNIFIIAGEPSGDMRGGELLRELKNILPDASFWGIGGDRMERQGVDLIEHVRNLSLVGAWEVIKKLPRIRAQYRMVTKKVLERKPDLAILIDYPGFNLKIAGFLHQHGIPVIYYVVPQVWAWRKNRVKILRDKVDKALVLFKFEEDFLKGHGVNCEFTGHPLVDKAPEPAAVSRTGGPFSVALLAGSREHEIRSMLPVMLKSAEKIRRSRTDTRFMLAESSNIDPELYKSLLSGHEALDVSRMLDDTFGCLDKCDLAIVTSGTATLETAMMEKPMLVAYRASSLTYVLFRLFMDIPFLGLVNIISGKEIAPEYLQGEATPDKLSSKIMEIMDDTALFDGMKGELREVKRRLGEKGASKRAAEAVKRFIEERNIRNY